MSAEGPGKEQVKIGLAQKCRLEAFSDHRPYELRSLKEETSRKVFQAIPYETLCQIASNEIAIANLIWIKISKKSMVLLCQALSKSISVHTLALGGCGLSIETLKTLADNLQSFQSLVCLDLSDNEITDDGAIEIMQGVDRSTTVRYLYLGFNKIGSRGGYAIGQSIRRRNSLIAVDLSHNQLGNEAMSLAFVSYTSQGAEAIANAITSNGRENSLRFLQLTANGIGDYGVTAICHAVNQVPNLKTVYLNNNALEEEDVRRVIETTEGSECRIIINTSVTSDVVES